MYPRNMIHFPRYQLGAEGGGDSPLLFLLGNKIIPELQLFSSYRLFLKVVQVVLLLNGNVPSAFISYYKLNAADFLGLKKKKRKAE